jgi:GntP family gluconate:H+ symporter
MDEVHFLILILVLSVAFIILMTAKVKMHAFFVLILAALGVGLFAGLAPDKVISTIKGGFGNTLGAIGIVIVAGTCLGVVLEKTGAAVSMADLILSKVGKKNSSLAISLTGLIFGIPIFCDSGFVVLSPLNKSLAIRSRTSMAVMAVSLGSSLFAIHCLIPPHPGATAAAGIVGVDLWQLMWVGLLIAIPTAAAGFIWANTFGKRYGEAFSGEVSSGGDTPQQKMVLPNPYLSFIPILLPIFLISAKSVLALFSVGLDSGLLPRGLSFVGDPSVALIIGLALSLVLVKKWDGEVLNDWLGAGVKNAGSILAITAAGGAFGAILKETGIGLAIGNTLAPLGLGLLLPFLIAAGLKTAQGSSTVAVITSASLVMPLLPELQLGSEWGAVFAVLSMGAGSMVASHANDSYFWVVTKFSGIRMETSLKVFTTATIIMGVTAQILIYVLGLLIA